MIPMAVTTRAARPSTTSVTAKVMKTAAAASATTRTKASTER